MFKGNDSWLHAVLYCTDRQTRNTNKSLRPSWHQNTAAGIQSAHSYSDVLVDLDTEVILGLLNFLLKHLNVFLFLSFSQFCGFLLSSFFSSVSKPSIKIHVQNIQHAITSLRWIFPLFCFHCRKKMLSGWGATLELVTSWSEGVHSHQHLHRTLQWPATEAETRHAHSHCPRPCQCSFAMSET